MAEDFARKLARIVVESDVENNISAHDSQVRYELLRSLVVSGRKREATMTFLGKPMELAWLHGKPALLEDVLSYLVDGNL